MVSARELLHARHGVFGEGHLLAAFVQLANLHVHRPDHLVEAIAFDHGALDRVLLRLEGLGLLRHVLGERVQRCEALFRVLAQLLQLHQRAEFLFDFLDRLGGRGRIVLGLARGFANARELGGQLRADGANRIELALERADGVDRLDDFDRRRLQLRAQIVELRAFLAQRFNRRLVLERLRCQLIHRQAVFLQLAVRRRDLLGDALRFVDLVQHGGDALLDLLEALGAILVAADFLSEVVELLEREIGLLARPGRAICWSARVSTCRRPTA